MSAFLLAFSLLAAAFGPMGNVAHERRAVLRRLVPLEATLRQDFATSFAAVATSPFGPLGTTVATAAGWQTIGGCGAGSATGIGGIKWIGRNVRGGVVNLQSQATYVPYRDGYAYAVNNQLTTELTDSLSVGAVVPYLYKYINDPYELGYDLSNQGLGDINLLVTGRLGPVNATSLTLSIGLPTGTHAAEFLPNNPLPQDRQLGVGKVSAGLLVDHVFDNLWGPTVLGASASYPGAANALENFRAPSGSVYGYCGYLLGAFVPAAGLSATAFWGQDRDRGLPSDSRPPAMVAGNLSLEWSNDWLAVLAGFSQPFWTDGRQPWTAGVGFALAPF
ncbi:MAG TPA: hypothetical protein VGG33_27575 [Polyangia bacterium]